MIVFFVFVGEGSSDAELVPHLQRLCVKYGASEAVGVVANFAHLSPPPKRDVKSKVVAALKMEPGANLVFVHRDADGPSEEQRLAEIHDACADAAVPSIPVIPTQETESWLLLSEQAIRMVAGNPRGKVPLKLVSANDVEGLSGAKERLQDALLTACDLSGRRREKFRKKLSQLTRLLMERLDVEGPLQQVPAWQRLERRIEQTLANMK